MRRSLLVCLVALTLSVAAGPAFAGEAPVTRHLHMLTTPNGKTHAIAGGVTAEALIGFAMTVVPRLLRHDPRVASGPIALALSDMLTLLIYFNLARLLLVRMRKSPGVRRRAATSARMKRAISPASKAATLSAPDSVSGISMVRTPNAGPFSSRAACNPAKPG